MAEQYRDLRTSRGMVPPPPPFQEPPKKRKVWPWVVGSVIGTIVVLAAIGSTMEPEPAEPVDLSFLDDDSGLTSYEGTGVEELVALLPQSTIQLTCDSIDTYGYSAARQAYLEADPQIGSDAYEGAVFDRIAEEC